MLHALPVLPALRRALPAARIDWVVEDRAAGLLRGRADLDRVVVLPRGALREARRRPLRRAGLLRSFLRDLRAGGYDAALDLQGNLKSGLVTRASGAPLRFGLARPVAREGNHLFTTRRVRPPGEARHRVERNLALVAAFLGRPVAYEPPGFPTPPEARSAADRVLSGLGLAGRRFAVLHPGTSGFGAYKRWPPARFADLARRLAAAGMPSVVTYAPGERDLAEEVAAASDGAAVPLASESLPFLAEVLRRCACFAAADTGPLHLAALLGTPLVGLFGPKDPAIYGPYGLRADGTPGLLPVVARPDVACRPCPLRTCADPVCMTGLAAERVFEPLARGAR